MIRHPPRAEARRLGRESLATQRQSLLALLFIKQHLYDPTATLSDVREVINCIPSRFQSEGLIRIQRRRIWTDDREGIVSDVSSDRG